MSFEGIITNAPVALGEFNKTKFIVIDFVRGLDMAYIRTVTLTLIKAFMMFKAIFRF